MACEKVYKDKRKKRIYKVEKKIQEENFHEEVYFLFLLLKLRCGRTNNVRGVFSFSFKLCKGSSNVCG